MRRDKTPQRRGCALCGIVQYLAYTWARGDEHGEAWLVERQLPKAPSAQRIQRAKKTSIVLVLPTHVRPVKKIIWRKGMGRGVSIGLANYIRRRDGGICVYCQADYGAHIDHVLCVKHGGRTIKENLVLACKTCNMKKRDKLCEVWIARAFKHLLDVGESLDWVDTA